MSNPRPASQDVALFSEPVGAGANISGLCNLSQRPHTKGAPSAFKVQEKLLASDVDYVSPILQPFDVLAVDQIKCFSVGFVKGISAGNKSGGEGRPSELCPRCIWPTLV